MIKIFHEQVKVDHPKNKDTHIELNIYYKKGKGYHVNALPIALVKREGYSMREFNAYSGFNDTILEATRKSKKRDEQAIAIYKENKTKYLDFFKQKGYQVIINIKIKED